MSERESIGQCAQHHPHHLRRLADHARHLDIRGIRFEVTDGTQESNTSETDDHECGCADQRNATANGLRLRPDRNNGRWLQMADLAGVCWTRRGACPTRARADDV